MKLLILITISIISLNVFAEVGENSSAAGICPLLDNSSKRVAKPQEVINETTAPKPEETKTISK